MNKYIKFDGEILNPDQWVTCPCCDDRYQIKELKYWDDDGACRPVLLCAGCDFDLVPLDDTNWS